MNYNSLAKAELSSHTYQPGCCQEIALRGLQYSPTNPLQDHWVKKLCCQCTREQELELGSNTNNCLSHVTEEPHLGHIETLAVHGRHSHLLVERPLCSERKLHKFTILRKTAVGSCKLGGHILRNSTSKITVTAKDPAETRRDLSIYKDGTEKG